MFLWTIAFVFWRFCQIFTLIPVMGMLAWFVHGFVESNALTPDYILILFIVTVLALSWAIFTLFSYHRSSTNATAVAFVDLLFVGALIGAVYSLRHINNADCGQVTRDDNWRVNFGSLGAIEGPDWDITVSKPCAMLTACWAFAIMNTIMFFFTAVLAWLNGDRLSAGSSYDRKYYRDGRYHNDRRRSRSRQQSYSRRSSHSRAYHV